MRMSSLIQLPSMKGKEKGVGNAQKARNLDASAYMCTQPWHKH